MRKRTKPSLKIFFAVIFVFVLVFCAESIIGPNIEVIAEHHCANRAAEIINSAVLNELASDRELIESAVKISRSADGKITSVTSSGYLFSIIKERITKQLLSEFSETQSCKSEVPLGALFGIPTVFSSPKIPVYIYASGAPQADISGGLVTTGINQSIYRVTLTYRAKITSIIAFHPASTVVEDEIVLAEIVFSGEVPQVVINR